MQNMRWKLYHLYNWYWSLYRLFRFVHAQWRQMRLRDWVNSSQQRLHDCYRLHYRNLQPEQHVYVLPHFLLGLHKWKDMHIVRQQQFETCQLD